MASQVLGAYKRCLVNWDPIQSIGCFSMFGNFQHKYNTAVLFYNGNSCSSKTVSLYWKYPVRFLQSHQYDVLLKSIARRHCCWTFQIITDTAELLSHHWESICNSFDDGIPVRVDFMFWYPITKWVAMTWRGWEDTSRVISQTPQCTNYPTLHRFVTEMCTHVHISVTKMVHCGIWDWCIAGFVQQVCWVLQLRANMWQFTLQNPVIIDTF